jgi:hypothetical protein
MLCEDKVDIFTLLEGNDDIKGIFGERIVNLNAEKVVNRLFELRPDSKELSILVKLLPSLLLDGASRGEKAALHAALICLRMLADQNETLINAFLKLIETKYAITTLNGGLVARVIQMAAVALRDEEKPESNPHSLTIRDILDSPRFSEDMKFLEMMSQFTRCDHWYKNISLPAAIELASAIVQDTIAARVWEANRHHFQIAKVLIREPSLVTATALARMMLATDYTDPTALMLAFESAENDLDMELKDATLFWRNISDSKQIKNTFTVLTLINELLENQLTFSDICEVATDLVNKRKSFLDIYEELSTLLPHRPSFDNLMTQLCQNGRELQSKDEREAYEDSTGVTEERTCQQITLQELEMFFPPDAFKLL